MTFSLVLIAALLCCFALSFFFSGSETAVISVNRYRLRGLHEQGDPVAGRVLAMLGNTQRLLVLVLVANNFVNVLTALLFNLLLQNQWPALNRWSVLGIVNGTELLSLLILTPLIVMFAEILPKAYFRAQADSLIARIRPVLLVALFLLRPFIIFFEFISRWMLTPLSEQRTRAVRQLTRKDVINLILPEERVEAGETASDAAVAEAPAPATTAPAVLPESEAEEEEPEASDERRMIHNIIQLQERRAYEIMTPLVDLVAVQLGRIDVESFRSIARSSGFSRFPVYRDRIVNLLGYIDVFRFLREWKEGMALEEFVERALYVPETKRVDDLLQEFLKQRVKNAIVVDEYGGCSGWISREDMLEEIVGELVDELDDPLAQVVELEGGVYQVPARMEISALNEVLDSSFDDEDWETLGGLIFNEMGRIPREADTVVIDGWRATIVRMQGNRIDLVRLARES